ncbi:Predicted transcriptional regulator YdeE, contains AraC-type DNA-binding domain [Gracilibacillus ureilyticus]|uniref:Predicted transcriptional regulator YdeE, contains AraC-type DNA-binding domain n=1 Tax=Gracilibacillus ureilyticus TaxID=531814 RepID=A0A1H9TWX1_9BACI|nr:GyrI-like domain-containing protein [Gracilibacillus ureilyticus]SES01407.1 Predicted transcriptional regulator YdeE, contains AraC-type DNA-binding domain [Gracilibacillus ureilyticus]
MNTEVVLKEFNCIGIKNSCAFKDYPIEIPKTFDILHNRLNELQDKVKQTAALYEPGDKPGAEIIGTYYATAVVDNTTIVPEGMARKIIPSRKYARLTHIGEMATIGKSYDKISAWIIENGYSHDRDWIIELYGDNFDPGSPDSELEIYIPVK